MRPQTRIKFAVRLAAFVSASALLGLWSNLTQAVTISPVLVELSPDRRITSITISNTTDHPMSFQTQTLAWTQPDGTDAYADSEELIVVPPIAKIAAGGSQIFRVTMHTASTPQERAFRLVFEDVTEIVAAVHASGETAVDVRINHSLPVFIAASGKTSAQPQLGACASRADATVTAATTKATKTTPAPTGCVRLDNIGSHYLQIKSLTVTAADWHKDLNSGARVLAGAWHQWTFELPPHALGPIQVHAETSAGPVTFPLPNPAH
jgi:fimbrial chaperone protein